MEGDFFSHLNDVNDEGTHKNELVILQDFDVMVDVFGRSVVIVVFVLIGETDCIEVRLGIHQVALDATYDD